MHQALQFPSGLDAAGFLRRHWQCEPLLMRQALPGFQGCIGPEELAGLACEPDVESRLILEQDGDLAWQVRHGPFDEDDFAGLPPSRWTLLVQDVDKLIPDVAALLAAFRFVPDWRVDDIMISYAADGGSVGPHVDEYDVFLVQAAGRRRWRFDTAPHPDLTFIPDLDLRILQRFDPDGNYVLEPGDVLYLPPGVPHWGIADGPCITWSVGFRAASWRELGTSWFDYVGEHRLTSGRFRDQSLAIGDDAGEIQGPVFQRIRKTLEDASREAPDALFREWFGRFVTEPKEHLQVYPADVPLSPESFREKIGRCAVLERNGSSRLAYCRGEGGTDLLFANGAALPLPSGSAAFLSLLSKRRALHREDLDQWLDRPGCLDLLCNLYNEGHYEIVSA